MFQATPESPRMFKSDLFDFFSRTPPVVVPLIYVPIISYLAYQAHLIGVDTTVILVEFAVGIFVWTFTEYWLHRTLFHWIPNDTWGAKMHFFIHGVHHDWINDKLRLVMPPAASLSFAVIFYGVFSALGAITDPAWVPAFYSGFIAGYLGYDMIHYYMHHFKPKSRYMRQLRQHHLAHHHARPDGLYGVSTTLWDRVFNTL